MKKRRLKKRRCFLNAYFNQTREDRAVLPFQIRDVAAALALYDALKDLGFRYAGSILNPPAEGTEIRPVDHSVFRPGDLIFQVTRPPKDDKEYGNKKGIPRSYSSLEQVILGPGGPMAEWFKTLTRKDIVLTPRALAVSPAIAARRTTEYLQYTSSRYKYTISADGEKRPWKKSDARTATFLVYCSELWKDGPSFLSCFGLSGLDTLIWCRVLATRFPHLLTTTPFCMAEIPTDCAPIDPMTTIFVDEWPAEILGTAPWTPPAAPARGRRGGTPPYQRPSEEGNWPDGPVV